MIRTTAALALTLSSAAGMAFAQDSNFTPSWEGGYVGGQVGYAYGEFNLNSGSLGDLDENNVIGGLTAGYLWSMGNNWYLGPEFQYDWTDLSVTDASSGQTASFDGIARLKLIAGYAMGNGLLYGSAGFAYADFNNVGSVIDVDKNSYVVGLGYDWRLDQNWTIGGEYMYHNFDNAGSSGGDVNLNTIHVKATFRF